MEMDDLDKIVPLDMFKEKIIRVDILVVVFSKLPRGYRIVDLECGHAALTKTLNHACCKRCQEMCKRSIKDGSEDYDAFRHHGKRDEMVWEDDPVRLLNEKTDLGGNLV